MSADAEGARGADSPAGVPGLDGFKARVISRLDTLRETTRDGATGGTRSTSE